MSQQFSGSNSEEEALTMLEHRRGGGKRPAGRRKFKETRHPVYRGVRRRGAAGKWVCELREPTEQRRIWVGTYPTPEMAALAHDVAALALRGRLAALNFADSAWRLPSPQSNDPKDIREAAGKAVAEVFSPTECEGVARNVESTMRVEVDNEYEVVGAGEYLTPSCYGGDEIGKMAEVALYSPAAGRMSFVNWDQVEFDCDVVDVSLWSYSF